MNIPLSRQDRAQQDRSRWLVAGLAALARLLHPRRDPSVRLAELSDHMLADIGLRRDQISALTQSGDPRLRRAGRPRAKEVPAPEAVAPRPPLLTQSSHPARSGVVFTAQAQRRSRC